MQIGQACQQRKFFFMMPDRSSEPGPLDARAVLLIVSILVFFLGHLLQDPDYENRVRGPSADSKSQDPPHHEQSRKIGRENL